MVQNKALIAGATGIVGRRLVEHLTASGDWQVIGLSRRPPKDTGPDTGATADVEFLSVDLTDEESCRRALRSIDGITHILYTARHDFGAHRPEPIEANARMLRNTVEAVEAGDHALQHVHIVQGTKYYGSNLGPFKTPAEEDDPRTPVDNFYFAQEDYLIDRCGESGWSWSASRPHGILDDQTGIARNMTQLIAVYAAILKEQGQPLYFPGTPGNFDALYQCTNTKQLAKAIAWMACEPRCANQAFNVINGDYVRWRDLWPVFAEHFAMEAGPVRTVKLAVSMPDKAGSWNQIVEKYDLQRQVYEDVALWDYGDHLFTPHWDMMSSMDKARRYGFADAPDTVASFLHAFKQLRCDRVVP
ncbi:MAG: SDR family oxidoreductase [Rhodospirillaceae bacterium]|jgi:nucleoside-diphosphate-sugar epimerase|nr:SDR family oxidoreductase [Rhodospirillaceae bacterium]